MFRKGHTGMIKVKRPTEKEPHGTLEIKVRINGNAANTGNVKDLKQLSGGMDCLSATVCLPWSCRSSITLQAGRSYAVMLGLCYSFS